jgi:hypothetical protein
MVRVGSHSVQLIDALTKQALPEFTSGGGDHFVEAEPNAEYFVRVEAHAPDCQSIACVYVDENYIGYNWYHGLDQYLVGELGACNVEKVVPSGEIDTLAFRFAKATGSSLATGVGQVQVNWTEGLEALETHRPNIGRDLHQWNANNGGNAATSGKKALKSELGHTAGQVEFADTAWTHGAVIGTIILHYRSAAGLLAAGAFASTGVSSSATSASNRRKRSRPSSVSDSASSAAGCSASSSIVDLTGGTQLKRELKRRNGDAGGSSSSAIRIE